MSLMQVSGTSIPDTFLWKGVDRILALLYIHSVLRH